MAIKTWRDFFARSGEAMALERSLSPRLVEQPSSRKSTANTDVQRRTISLDVSQSPLKCALGYAYELKNLENSEKFRALITFAKAGSISKSNFVKQVLALEAEAIYFRCKVFYELGVDQESFPCNQVYLDIYNVMSDESEADVVTVMANHIQENGILRREYAAKKYYADSYDFYTGKHVWPKHYDVPRDTSVVLANDMKKSLEELRRATGGAVDTDIAADVDDENGDPNILT
ncbi:MAG: hypothetical protein P1U32_04080 [Legionellaceae bacterium]|nr:hypothetical protein [Legionellaceae bacterium]